MTNLIKLGINKGLDKENLEYLFRALGDVSRYGQSVEALLFVIRQKFSYVFRRALMETFSRDDVISEIKNVFSNLGDKVIRNYRVIYDNTNNIYNHLDKRVCIVDVYFKFDTVGTYTFRLSNRTDKELLELGIF